MRSSRRPEALAVAAVVARRPRWRSAGADVVCREDKGRASTTRPAADLEIADLKKMHAGQNNWQEQIITDPEQDASYNSGAPGFHFAERLHPDTPTVFVVIAGELNWTVEASRRLRATRGAIMNIMKGTIFSFDVAGTQNALWVEVNPANYKTVYPPPDRNRPRRPAARSSRCRLATRQLLTRAPTG